MKELFAIAVAMSLAGTVMAEQVIVSANFYGQDRACETGVKIKKGTELSREGVTFTMMMNGDDTLTLWVAFEVTREDSASEVVVQWLTPEKELAYCQKSEYTAKIPAIEKNGETYHTRACRTLSNMVYQTKKRGDITYDCKGTWTVRLCDANGDVLKTANGSLCEYFVVVK